MHLRELEWHFGTKLGRNELVTQAKHQRLAIVYLNRAHTYSSLDSILEELSPKIIELAPKSLPAAYKVNHSLKAFKFSNIKNKIIENFFYLDSYDVIGTRT